VTGRVQGVGFRLFALGVGTRLGLRGVVRNLADGSVESTVGGEPAAIDEFAVALAKGPRFSSVTSVERTETSVENELPISFRII
jgi:acylphosphatase